MFKILKDKNNFHHTLAIWVTIFLSIFLITCVFGEGLGGSLGLNHSCLKYIGCSVGFFGYDAIEHFLFGVTATLSLVLLFEISPKYSILDLNSKYWKNILIIIISVMFISVLWEFLECAHDVFRSNLLNQILINRKLNINLLDQPNNLDTMGDLFFSLIGSIIPFFFIKIKNK